MNFLETLLIILGIILLYNFIRVFFRVILPIIIAVRAVKKAQSQFQQQPSYQDTTSATPEGEIIIEKTKPQTDKIIKDDMGQTVDFEEIN